ncbi:hypothetical protein BGX21_003864, partial [Mortierella sp. AD011]
ALRPIIGLQSAVTVKVCRTFRSTTSSSPEHHHAVEDSGPSSASKQSTKLKSRKHHPAVKDSGPSSASKRVTRSMSLTHDDQDDGKDVGQNVSQDNRVMMMIVI